MKLCIAMACFVYNYTYSKEIHPIVPLLSRAMGLRAIYGMYRCLSSFFQIEGLPEMTVKAWKRPFITAVAIVIRLIIIIIFFFFAENGQVSTYGSQSLHLWRSKFALMVVKVIKVCTYGGQSLLLRGGYT